MPRNDMVKSGRLTDIAYYILLSLIKENHGYSIMKTVKQITNGEVEIGPASLYSTLKKLVNENMIEQVVDQSFNTKTYIITKKGSETLKNEYDRRKRMIQHADQILQREDGHD
ncbi:PadR family transcriptional regulator [Virgibacillus sp. SK37]|uniref:PadR family transcriptional regulator n=1 Tax=Virgibacillus sp. SK37 TaxID=403957 RepID=UPI0004D109D3|nr:PadR family transcriptional regulator [Virgibacillus sp. SK37]AIF42165.1 PadR family transcriptional regulator [Virgibacillus sp. SK37]